MYQVILADPPWQYHSRANHKTRFRGGIHGHYKGMSMRDIKALPVREIAAPRSILLLWTTFPYLREQIEVFEAWGFKYRTVAYSWMKSNPKSGTPFFGVGYYTASNVEVCLLGTRGAPLKPHVKQASAIYAPRGKHSAKPLEAIRRTDLQYPGPCYHKLELFARSCSPGWDALGNEIDGRDIRESLPALIAARRSLCEAA